MAYFCEVRWIHRRPVRSWFIASTALAAALCVSAPAIAQSDSDVINDEIIVTATHRQGDVAQDVAGAITAFSSEQLAILNYRDLTSLNSVMPNVQLEELGTSPGIANFTIRGLGINSSIPSIDPTVGVFVDGVYMGINAGVMVDGFDLEAVEVLRGPQGVLFGRNVTGGAVLIRTKEPTDKFSASMHAGLETGPNYTVDGSVSGPLAGPSVTAKIAVYYNNDAGWFRNLYTGKAHGASEELIVRGALKLQPVDSVSFLLRAEHGTNDGDGPAGQNHALFSRKSFDFSINEPGFFRYEWNQLIGEGNIDVPFGDGRFTAVAGWRELDHGFAADIDATPGTSPPLAAPFPIGLHAKFLTEQEQKSLELRYAGTFGPVKLTAGAYYFQQDLLYVENRRLFNGANVTGGGSGDFDTKGAFTAADIDIGSGLTANLGIRYTKDRKAAEVSAIRPLGGDVDAGTIAANFFDKKSWDHVTPRIGLQWIPRERLQVYGFWTKGFRGGGYNFRQTDPAVPPGPFDIEKQTAYELGLKGDFADNRIHINAALFHNTINGIQREVSTTGPLGISQVIANVGKVQIVGGEVDVRLRPSRNFTITGNVGFTDGNYKSLIFDLNGDGIINSRDFDLQLPRLSRWTYGVNAIWNVQLGDLGELTSRLTFSHRDASFYSDDNRGTLRAINMLDGNIGFAPRSSPLRVSLYGKNLLNRSWYSANSILPDAAPFGGDGAGPRPQPTFSPLTKGRVVGIDLRYDF